MGGPNKVAPNAVESRWVLEGGGVLSSAGTNTAQAGLDLEFRRRIPFHPHTLQLGDLSADNHWNLDIGVGGQFLGWADGRPGTVSAFARTGINYNLFNLIGFGLNFRGGYANVSDGNQTSGGLLWGAGLRFAGIVDKVTMFSEVGLVSQPAPSGEGRDKGVYGLAGLGYLF